MQLHNCSGGTPAMATQIDTAQRQIVVVKDARIRPMMGNSVLESLPLAGIPYSIVDPYILVHEATVRITPEQANQDTTHPHRGFDNLWYAISGSSSTGHSTGPGGTVRTLVGVGSPVTLGTPGLILDVELPTGGSVSIPVRLDFNGFVYMLEA